MKNDELLEYLANRDLTIDWPEWWRDEIEDLWDAWMTVRQYSVLFDVSWAITKNQSVRDGWHYAHIPS